MTNEEKARILNLVLGGQQLDINNLIGLKASDIIDVEVTARPDFKHNSLIKVKLINGAVRQFEYSRVPLLDALEALLGDGRITNGTEEVIRKQLLDLGLTHNPEEINIDVIHGIALVLRTTSKSIRYYGEVRLAIEISTTPDPEPEPVETFILTQTSEPLITQSGMKLKPNGA